MSTKTTPPKTGKPSPTRRAPAVPLRTNPGGPLPTPAALIKRQAHRRRSVTNHATSHSSYLSFDEQ